MGALHNFNQGSLLGYHNGSREIEFDANVENIGLALTDSFTDRFEIALDRNGTARGSILTMTKMSVVGRVPGLNALPPSMAPICTVGSMNLWGFLRWYSRAQSESLRDFAGGEHELVALPSTLTRARANRSCRFAVASRWALRLYTYPHNAMVHQIASADSCAAILFAVETADLRLFDLPTTPAIIKSPLSFAPLFAGRPPLRCSKETPLSC